MHNSGGGAVYYCQSDMYSTACYNCKLFNTLCMCWDNTIMRMSNVHNLCALGLRFKGLHGGKLILF